MLDTKLKKSHKLTTIIITLCILIPAFLLTALYPRIGSIMKDKREKLEENYTEEPYYENYTLDDKFVNYAMETSYYIYASMMNELGNSLDVSVFEEYGWLNDYWLFISNVKYKANFNDGSNSLEKGNADVLGNPETAGFMTITFDSTGFLSDIQLAGDVSVALGSTNSLYAQANRSVNQFENNVKAYEEANQIEIDEKSYVPKDFEISIAIEPECYFIVDADYEYYDYYDHYYQLLDTGAIFVIVALAFVVALAALLLPFVKKLETGWEKLFCMPFEIMAGLGVGAAFGAVGMFYAMAYTCGYATELNPDLEILGYETTGQMWYILMLVLNFLGWALLFFAEYIVIASVRQFICGPVKYFKQRSLIVRFLRWIKKQCVRLYRYVTDIQIGEKMHGTILKIILANFVILTLICCMWVFGIIGVIIYSVLLYIGLRKYGETLQKQYDSVLHATEQMAEGNLKIAMEKELGVFQPIGDSLEKVQQGFEKAVVEEAKSQNMKTELITNVSHDLKTPLTAIITYVDLLKREDISEEERNSYIATLEQKSQRLKVLIEDLFEVSKAQSGNVTMNFMDVDIVNLMKQVRSEMSDQIEASNLTFRFNLPAEKVILSLDGQRTYRVFENLLSNALKYAMPYSRVYVDICNTDAEVKVVFRNVSAQELAYEPERLTERFVRGDASRKSEGSGLGLAIAKSFVELQYGKLNIDIDGDLFKVTITWSK